MRTLADLFGPPPPPSRRAHLLAIVGVVASLPEVFAAVVVFTVNMLQRLYAIHLACSPIRAAAPSTPRVGSPAAASASPARSSTESTPPLGTYNEVRLPSPVANLEGGYQSAMDLVRVGPDLEN